MKLLFPAAAALSAILAGGLGWRQAVRASPERVEKGGSRDTSENDAAAPEKKSFLPAGRAGEVWQVWAEKLLRAGTSEELTKVAGEVAAMEEYGERALVLRLLCARWAEVDPEGGLAWWRQEKPKGLEQMEVLLLTEWALRDVEQAWAAVSTEADEEKRTSTASGVGEALLRENPDIFWAWFQKAGVPLPPTGGKPSPAWLALARQHEQALATLAAKLGSATKDEAARYNIPAYAGLYQLLAQVKAERDPAAALEWANSAPEEVRNTCLGAVIPLLARTDLAAAGKALDAMKADPFNGNGRGGIMAEIGREMAKSDPRAAVEWMAKRPDGTSGVDVSTIGEFLGTAMKEGRLSPRDAFELIRTQESDGEVIRLNVLRRMWAGLPVEQLAETAAWLKNVDSDAKVWALSGLVTEWAKTNPQAALNFAAQSGDAGLRQQIYGEMLSPVFYNRNDPGAMADLLATIPRADRATVISAQIGRQYSDGMLELGGDNMRAFPSTVLVLADALAQTPADAARDGAAKRIFQTWGALEPDAALEWSTRQPDAELRQSALMGTMEGWAKYDAWAASQWLAEQPRGQDRDAATHQLARSLREVEPDSAWTWASDIGDESVRLEARAAVLRKWRDSDAEAARAAVSSLTGLNPAAQQKLSDTLAGKDK